MPNIITIQPITNSNHFGKTLLAIFRHCTNLFGLFPVTLIPSSCIFDMPMINAPPSLSFFTIVASSVAGELPKNVVPLRLRYGT